MVGAQPDFLFLKQKHFQNLNSLYFLLLLASCLPSCLFRLLVCLAACSATISDKSSLAKEACFSLKAASALACIASESIMSTSSGFKAISTAPGSSLLDPATGMSYP